MPRGFFKTLPTHLPLKMPREAKKPEKITPLQFSANGHAQIVIVESAC